MSRLATPNTVDLVLAHGECFDGFTSLWIANLVRGGAAEYKEVFYKEPPPDVAGRNVAILDFAYPREAYEKMCDSASSIIVLDHHETNERDLVGAPNVVFDMERSGARMAFEWFRDYIPDFHRAYADKLTTYVQDRDLWRWELDHSREVSGAMMALPFTFEAWLMFANSLVHQFGSVCIKGAAINQVMQRQVEKLAKSAVQGLVDNHPAWVVNGPYTHASELGNFLVNQPGPGVAAVWRYEHHKGRLYVSMRSSKDSGVNVARIAEGRGGGGHARAASFELYVPPGTLPFFGVSDGQ